LKPPRGVAGVSLFIGTKDEMTIQFALLATSTSPGVSAGALRDLN
jgi:hypothetical protein